MATVLRRRGSQRRKTRTRDKEKERYRVDEPRASRGRASPIKMINRLDSSDLRRFCANEGLSIFGIPRRQRPVSRALDYSPLPPSLLEFIAEARNRKTCRFGSRARKREREREDERLSRCMPGVACSYIRYTFRWSSQEWAARRERERARARNTGTAASRPVGNTMTL